METRNCFPHTSKNSTQKKVTGEYNEKQFPVVVQRCLRVISVADIESRHQAYKLEYCSRDDDGEQEYPDQNPLPTDNSALSGGGVIVIVSVALASCYGRLHDFV